jgi:hypothetical protein
MNLSGFCFLKRRLIMSTKRPAIITLLAAWFAISAILLVQLVFSGFAEPLAGWYRAYLSVAAVAYLVSAVGLWMMKKWGALFFAGFSAINQVSLILADQWTFTSLVTSGLLVLICFSQYAKMK